MVNAQAEMSVPDLNVSDSDNGPCGLHADLGIGLHVPLAPDAVLVAHPGAAGSDHLENALAANKTHAMSALAVDDFFAVKQSAAHASTVLKARAKALSAQDDPWASPF